VPTHKSKQKVVAAYPHPHEVSARFHKCWDSLRQYDFGHRRRIAEGGGHLANSSGANITNARNEIATAFLDRHDADWLWFVDTDMTFEPDVLDRLVDAAHPQDRPILGALCFSLQDGYRAAPTLYTIRPDGKAGRTFYYPKDTLVRSMTGTGCLLIHRTALETIRASGRFPTAYPFFQECAFGDLPVGEDLTFCIRAEAIGIPVHVDTSIKCGHEKPFIVDEEMYDAQVAAGVRDTPDVVHPTYVVVASKNRPEMLANLVSQVTAANVTPLVYDNGYPKPPAFDHHAAYDDALHEMWNNGIGQARYEAQRIGASRWNVAILNDDVEVGPGFLAQLEAGLRSNDDYWVAYPNHHGADIPDGAAVPTTTDKLAGQTMSGWAFMIRGETGLRFDEQFEWWYGDSDLQKQVEAAGKHVVCVGGCYANHLDPMRSTLDDPVRLDQARADEKRFAAKWGLNPDDLWLAQNRPVL
jgi:GT2 family glycosyltransferase